MTENGPLHKLVMGRRLARNCLTFTSMATRFPDGKIYAGANSAICQLRGFASLSDALWEPESQQDA